MTETREQLRRMDELVGSIKSLMGNIQTAEDLDTAILSRGRRMTEVFRSKMTRNRLL